VARKAEYTGGKGHTDGRRYAESYYSYVLHREEELEKYAWDLHEKTRSTIGRKDTSDKACLGMSS
jgi:hypothetical protein